MECDPAGSDDVVSADVALGAGRDDAVSAKPENVDVDDQLPLVARVDVPAPVVVTENTNTVLRNVRALDGSATI